MAKNVLLVLTAPLINVEKSLPTVLKSISHTVRDNLYVHFAPSLTDVNQNCAPPTNEVKDMMINLYAASSTFLHDVNVQLLLNNITSDCSSAMKQQSLKTGYDVVLYEDSSINSDHLLNYVKHCFPNSNSVSCQRLNCNLKGVDSSFSSKNVLKQYSHVVLGGTFDCLHNGHKILLSKACLLATESITVGVTHGEMNKKKTLVDLMESTDIRIKSVQDFISTVKPQLEQKIVPIEDPFGPSTVDERLECIVVSEETLRGGEMVNQKRKEKGLSHLDVDVIDLVVDPEHSVEEEEKISSSSSRIRLLGTLIKSVQKFKGSSSGPYVIGLTGGIASGKSSVCKRIQNLGAATIDCDKLGHKAYEPGSETLKQVVAAFGEEILTDKGEVNRRALGAIIFKDESQKKRLNEIVWPAIADLVRKEIKEEQQKGTAVVILEAAVLLEAGWNDMVHETWSCIISPQEAVKRLRDRNGFSEQESLDRINSQMTNDQRVAQSNVVLCTQWHPDVTQKHVEKAWALLQKRIGANNSVKSSI